MGFRQRGRLEARVWVWVLGFCLGKKEKKGASLEREERGLSYFDSQTTVLLCFVSQKGEERKETSQKAFSSYITFHPWGNGPCRHLNLQVASDSYRGGQGTLCPVSFCGWLRSPRVSHHLTNPGMMRFPKYQPRMVATMVSWCNNLAHPQ